MAHFAEVDQQNKVVRVLVIPDDQEARGQDYLATDLGLGGRWLQTSYNTYGNKHASGGTPFRGNFASVGFVYDQTLDVFYPPYPGDGWTLNPSTFLWDPPPDLEGAVVYNGQEQEQQEESTE